MSYRLLYTDLLNVIGRRIINSEDTHVILKGLIKLTGILQDHPLTIIQWQILLVVADNPGETITDLVNDGKLVCGTPSDIAVSVKRLGEGRHDRPGLGLLKKQQHEDDGRYFRLSLSPKGKKVVDKLKQQIKNVK